MLEVSGPVCPAKLRRWQVIAFAGCTALAEALAKENTTEITATDKRRMMRGDGWPN